ncbi:MAG: M28 family peptidase [Bacteroidales bacterium]|nr:M28 family peptidase [Bacteroidales bacterium]
MKTIRVIVLSLLVSFAGVMKAQEASVDTIMKHIRYLSSSRCEGRMAGTDGYDRAVQYAVGVLESYGVKPYYEDWESDFFTVERNVVENARMSTYFPSDKAQKDYVLGKDFACASMTGRGYADAPVVFCGYGIDNAIYDEYAKVDARGKIVLVMTGVPDHLPQSVSERYSTLRDKARVAQSHGAVAMVAINMSDRCRATEVQNFAYVGEGPQMLTFPILQATRWTGNAILADERITLDSVLSMMELFHRPCSFLLDKRISLDVNATYNPAAETGNVVGILESSDPRLRREIIVVGASMDHVGMQGQTCLFPGADNTTGVAALLETARLLSQVKDWMGRSVVFVIFGGGEHHHAGADVFLRNFPKLEWVDAFLNIEKVGSGDSIALMGAKRFPLLHGIALHADSIYTGYAKHDLSAMPQAEAIDFTRIGIPSLSFCTTNGRRYNHVPSDMAENIDRRMVARVATLFYHTLAQLCNGDYQGRSEDLRYERPAPKTK